VYILISISIIYVISCMYISWYMYGNKNKTSKVIMPRNKHVIIVLWTTNHNVLKHRMKKGQQLHKKNTKSMLVVTWKKNILNHENFVHSTNTYEDTFVCQAQEKSTIIHVVTSANHKRRAYHTFTRVYSNRTIIVHATNDWLRPEWPLLPRGRWYAMLNKHKDNRYNNDE
jgi:hypothetical protein